VVTLLRISELAGRSGVPASTLRYYERIGLVEPLGRSDNGCRVYDEATLERLAFIGRAKRLGMSLDDVATLLEAWCAGECEPLQYRLRRFVTGCDSLDRSRFATIRRRGDLATVLAAMDAAERAGLSPVKVNVVVTAGVNDDEVVGFTRFARQTGRVVRFIEYMPLDAQHAWDRHQVVAGAEIVRRISEVWPLEAVGGRGDDPAPADRYRFVDGGGEIGVIASVTDAFCGGCNRLRLTADGAIRNCPFAADEWSARDVMRTGGSDDDLARLLRAAVWAKLPGHGVNGPGFVQPARPMSRIGG
jgi:GTP 3',8-cyclase